ncbi:4-hydroxyphenylpyruvate dioxygenase [uncultured Paludibaculum sp.]|uniref:4-hydroxyphenylpyruvate dioxygenase n=1 Tax=uncultured Paludibaculum sp. TaxID=1765020 RepID=UPI002AAAD1D2|nr:4-hydroxyphenylpyruvate dioxygenase [uncultured Paludibaculum sp.]
MSESDVFPLIGIDHIHFLVANAKQAAYYYRAAFGFSITAYRGPETGTREAVSYVLEQDRIRFVFSTPLQSDNPMYEHIRRHGDGVRDIAFLVDDAAGAWRGAVDRGSESAYEPSVLEDDHGSVRMAGIKTYGDTIHSFISRHGYAGAFRPGFVAVTEPDLASRPTGLRQLDHIVSNVPLGEMTRWVSHYQSTLGFSLFQSFDDKDISTEYTALMSKVMAAGNGRIKFPINEPAAGRRKSQIEEYLDAYEGAGVQHIAMTTGNIVETVSRMQAQGVEFLHVPTTYYEQLQERIGPLDEPLDELARLGILVDRDEEGYLLQIFTKPVEDRPTLFFEIIQRKGSRSFGKGNFKALFEAIEREQQLRGNL